jgi:hypothetical protein
MKFRSAWARGYHISVPFDGVLDCQDGTAPLGRTLLDGVLACDRARSVEAAGCGQLLVDGSYSSSARRQLLAFAMQAVVL